MGAALCGTKQTHDQANTHRPTMVLNQIRDLDVVLIRTKAVQYSTKMSQASAFDMHASTLSGFSPKEKALEQWDRVGIALIDKRAMDEGLNHDTVLVVELLIPDGVRIRSLRQLQEESCAVCVRPLIMRGEANRSIQAEDIDNVQFITDEKTRHELFVKQTLRTFAAEQKKKMEQEEKKRAEDEEKRNIENEEKNTTADIRHQQSTQSAFNKDEGKEKKQEEVLAPNAMRTISITVGTSSMTRAELCQQLWRVLVPVVDQPFSTVLDSRTFASAMNWIAQQLSATAAKQANEDEAFLASLTAFADEARRQKRQERLRQQEQQRMQMLQDAADGVAGVSSRNDRVDALHDLDEQDEDENNLLMHAEDLPKLFKDLKALEIRCKDPPATMHMSESLSDVDMRDIMSSFLANQQTLRVKELHTRWIASIGRQLKDHEHCAQLVSGAFVSACFQSLSMLQPFGFYLPFDFSNARKGWDARTTDKGKSNRGKIDIVFLFGSYLGDEYVVPSPTPLTASYVSWADEDDDEKMCKIEAEGVRARRRLEDERTRQQIEQQRQARELQEISEKKTKRHQQALMLGLTSRTIMCFISCTGVPSLAVAKRPVRFLFGDRFLVGDGAKASTSASLAAAAANAADSSVAPSSLCFVWDRNEDAQDRNEDAHTHTKPQRADGNPQGYVDQTEVAYHTRAPAYAHPISLLFDPSGESRYEFRIQHTESYDVLCKAAVSLIDVLEAVKSDASAMFTCEMTDRFGRVIEGATLCIRPFYDKHSRVLKAVIEANVLEEGKETPMERFSAASVSELLQAVDGDFKVLHQHLREFTQQRTHFSTMAQLISRIEALQRGDDAEEDEGQDESMEQFAEGGLGGLVGGAEKGQSEGGSVTDRSRRDGKSEVAAMGIGSDDEEEEEADY